MTIKEIRELTGLSQAKFAEKYHIPKRSIENWESETRQCPIYVVELLEYRVKLDINTDKDLDKKDIFGENIPTTVDEADEFIDELW